MRHEMCVRSALGAQAANIMRLVLRQGLAVAAAGVVIGIAFALAGARYVEPLLYQVARTSRWCLVSSRRRCWLRRELRAWYPRGAPREPIH